MHRRPRGDQNPARVAFVAGKKVGNAVARNRAKRRLRAVVSGLTLAPGNDYVIVGRTGALAAPFDELSTRVAGVFQKLEGRTS